MSDEGPVSVIVPTLGRATLRPLLERLAAQRAGFPFEVVLVPQGPLDTSLPLAENVRVVPTEAGRGYAHVRNVGLAAARGDVLCFVDDDAEPDVDWLERITAPLRSGEFAVATADLHVSLGAGHLADAISLLGFPGGAAAGWRTMWGVEEDGTTRHLCTGNCALSRAALEEVGPFDEGLVDGSEDVDLGDRLVAAGHAFRYVEEAKIEHAPRTGLGAFFGWNLRRGRSAYDLSRRERVGGHVRGRLRSSLRILGRALRTRYGPTVLGVMTLQYAAQGLGYLQARVGHRPVSLRGDETAGATGTAPDLLATVVVPTYDRARDLGRCLSALRAQTHDRFEVLVVDNRSADGTAALLADLREKDPRIRSVREEEAGLCFARNRGIREALGSIIAFLDDDAVPPRGWLDALIRGFSRPEVGGCGGPTRPLWERRPSHLVLSSRRARAYLGEYDRGPVPRDVDWLIGANGAYRREVFEACGAFRTDTDRVGSSLRSGGDVEMGLRASRRWRLRYEPAAWVDHGVSASKLSWRYLVRMAFAIGQTRAEASRGPEYAAAGLPSGTPSILDAVLGAVAALGYVSARIAPASPGSTE